MISLEVVPCILILHQNFWSKKQTSYNNAKYYILNYQSINQDINIALLVFTIYYYLFYFLWFMSILSRSAPDLLHDICVYNQWGEPIYSYSVTEAGQIKLYLCKVRYKVNKGKKYSKNSEYNITKSQEKSVLLGLLQVQELLYILTRPIFGHN